MLLRGLQTILLLHEPRGHDSGRHLYYRRNTSEQQTEERAVLLGGTAHEVCSDPGTPRRVRVHGWPLRDSHLSP